MMATHQLLINDIPGGCSGHRAFLAGDRIESAAGRIIAGQFLVTAWTLREIRTGRETYVMGPMNRRPVL